MYIEFFKILVLFGVLILSLSRRFWFGAVASAAMLAFSVALVAVAIFHKQVPGIEFLLGQPPEVVCVLLVALPALALSAGLAMTRPKTPQREPVDILWLVLVAAAVQVVLVLLA